MPKPPTRTELQKQATYWQEKYNELCRWKDMEIAKLKEENLKMEQELSGVNWNVQRVRDLWNKWQHIDKTTDTAEAIVVFDPETLRELLSLLHP